VDVKRAERKMKSGKESVGTWRRIPNGWDTFVHGWI
jgi:hypothetical protein